MSSVEQTAGAHAAHEHSEAQRRAAGHVALFFVQLFFGLFPIFGKWALEPGGFTTRTIVAWRMLFAAVGLGATAFALYGRRAWPRRADILHFACCSILGVSANMVLYMEGLSRSTATNAGLMVCLIPVFTFTIAALVRQEVFKLTRALGVLLALSGASMLFWAESAERVRLHGFGNFLMVLNTLCYAGYLVWSRPLTRSYPPLVVIAWVFLLSLPCVPWLAHGEQMFPAGASQRAWTSMAFIMVFPTTLAYLFNSFALSRLRASTTAVYVYGQSLITGLAGALLLGERLTRGTLAAGVLIFAGIFLVARRGRAPATEARA